MGAVLLQIALKLVEVLATWYKKKNAQLTSARHRSKNIQRNISARAKARSQKDRDQQAYKDYLRDRALDILFSERKLPKIRSKRISIF